jgi:hypothetical protein
MIELKKHINYTDNTGTLVSRNIPLQMPLLSDVVFILLSSNSVLTTNGKFLDCATILFGERYIV